MQWKVNLKNITWAISLWVCWHLRKNIFRSKYPYLYYLWSLLLKAEIILERHESPNLLNFHVIIWLWKWSSLKIRLVMQKRSLNIHCKHEVMKPWAWGVNIIISSYTSVDSHESSWLYFSWVHYNLGNAPLDTPLFSQHPSWNVGPKLDNFRCDLTSDKHWEIMITVFFDPLAMLLLMYPCI